MSFDHDFTYSAIDYKSPLSNSTYVSPTKTTPTSSLSLNIIASPMYHTMFSPKGKKADQLI